MFAALLISIFLAIAFFSAENLIATIVGFIVTTGLTQWLKNATGAFGTAAFFLAVILSFVVAAVAVTISGLLNGNGFSWDTVPQSALQIFALATAAYKLLLADPE